MDQRGIVQCQLVNGVAQILIGAGVNGVEAGEDHGFDIFEARQGAGSRARVICNRIADARFGDLLDVGDNKPHFASR